MNIVKEKQHICLNFLGIKIKFLNLKKLKYIIYRRYFKSLYINNCIYPIISRRTFMQRCIFSKNKFALKLKKKFLWKVTLFKFLTNAKLEIPVMDFNITNKCTLKCKDCGSLIPFYPEDKKWTITFEDFKKDLDTFLNSVNSIYRMKLIGGEPLMVKDLDLMLEYSLKNKKIKNVEITTNGTILFTDNQLKILNKYRRKALIVLSDYSSNKDLKCLKYEQIINQLDNNKIKFLHPRDNWFERGDIYNRKKDIQSLIKTLKRCWQRDCIALFDGQYHICTRSFAIHRLTDFKFSENEYIDIRISPPQQKNFTKEYGICS